MAALTLSKVRWWLSVQANGVSGLVSSRRCAVSVLAFGMNGLMYVTSPRNDWSSSSFSGCSIYFSAETFFGSGCFPSALQMMPKNLILSSLMRHLSGFNLRPDCSQRTIIWCMLRLWSSSYVPYVTMSAAMPVTPEHPSNVWSILAWKTSCRILRPNGM